MVSAEWHRPPLDKVMELFVFFCWVISFQYTFSRSGNSMVRLSVLYHHRLTSKIQFEPEILELRGYPSFSLMEFYDITYIYVFEVEEFNGDTFRILRLPVDLENPGLTGNTGTSRLPIFFPGGILWYHLYLCFRGRRNSMVTRSEFYDYRVDLENPGLTGNTGTSRLPIFFPGGILWYHLYLCFRGRGIQWWHVQNSTTTGWPRKPRFNRKYWNFKVTHLFPWWNFMISPIFMFSRSRNSMVTRSEFYDYRLTSKIQV